MKIKLTRNLGLLSENQVIDVTKYSINADRSIEGFIAFAGGSYPIKINRGDYIRADIFELNCVVDVNKLDLDPDVKDALHEFLEVSDGDRVPYARTAGFMHRNALAKALEAAQVPMDSTVLLHFYW